MTDAHRKRECYEFERGLQRNESSGCIHELEKLAQQAQDEKGVGDAEN